MRNGYTKLTTWILFLNDRPINHRAGGSLRVCNVLGALPLRLTVVLTSLWSERERTLFNVISNVTLPSWRGAFCLEVTERCSEKTWLDFCGSHLFPGLKGGFSFFFHRNEAPPFTMKEALPVIGTLMQVNYNTYWDSYVSEIAQGCKCDFPTFGQGCMRIHAALFLQTGTKSR